MELNTVLFAFGLTFFAGLATGIGSALAFLHGQPIPGFFQQRLASLLVCDDLPLSCFKT